MLLAARHVNATPSGQEPSVCADPERSHPPGKGRRPLRDGHQLPRHDAVEPSAPIPSLPGIGERVDRAPMVGDLRTPVEVGTTDEMATSQEGKPHATTLLAEPTPARCGVENELQVTPVHLGSCDTLRWLGDSVRCWRVNLLTRAPAGSVEDSRDLPGLPWPPGRHRDDVRSGQAASCLAEQRC